MLTGSTAPLCATYDLAMLDLDGVVYIGPAAVPGAPEHLRTARESGLHLAFITNNASRPPEDVAKHLQELGVDASPDDVVTSAQAAARLLAEKLRPGARVMLLGGRGLEAALREEGLDPVAGLADDPEAVVTGYGPDVLWRQLMQGAVLIRNGLFWVASNTDLTIPTDYGVGPGHGVLVKMLQDFSGVTPVVAGKPERPLLDETMRRVGGEHPLMVGDRLDTDIEGANNAGVDSLLVMTGVTGLSELVAATVELRPTYIAADLGGLMVAHPAPEATEDGFRASGWTAAAAQGRLTVTGDGTVDDWWRVVACGAWDHLDRTGAPVDIDGLEPPVPAGARTAG